MSYSIESAIGMLEREAERNMYGSGDYQRGKDMAECAAESNHQRKEHQ